MILYYKLSFALILPAILGYAVLRLIFAPKNTSYLFLLALGYGLGMGILSQWMLVLGILKIPFSVPSIGVPLVLLSVVSWFGRTKLKWDNPLELRAFEPVKPNGFIPLLLTLYILYYLIYIFWACANIPISAWDAFATVAFKAKIFFFERGIDFNLPHAYYPLHVPFIESWLAICMGTWNGQLVNLVFAVYALSFVIGVFYFLKEYARFNWALLGVALLVASNLFSFHATISYRDFIVLYYNCSTVMLLILWNRYKDQRLLLLAAVFSGFTAFVKIEGSLYLGIHLFLLLFILFKDKSSILKAKVQEFFYFAVPSIGIYGIYYVYRIFKGIVIEEKGNVQVGLSQLGRIPSILEKIFFELFGYGNWHLLWFLAVVSLFQIKAIKDNIEIQILLLAIIVHFVLMIVIGTFTGSYVYIGGDLAIQAVSRLILHFFPLAVLLVILINCPRRRRS